MMMMMRLRVMVFLGEVGGAIVNGSVLTTAPAGLPAPRRQVVGTPTSGEDG